MAKYFFFFFVFLGLHPWHMEVPRLGAKLELQLPAFATATAMPDPSHAYNLHHSSWQHQILHLLSEARDRTCILTATSRIRFCCATTGTPQHDKGFIREKKQHDGSEPGTGVRLSVGSNPMSFVYYSMTLR